MTGKMKVCEPDRSHACKHTVSKMHGQSTACCNDHHRSCLLQAALLAAYAMKRGGAADVPTQRFTSMSILPCQSCLFAAGLGSSQYLGASGPATTPPRFECQYMYHGNDWSMQPEQNSRMRGKEGRYRSVSCSDIPDIDGAHTRCCYCWHVMCLCSQASESSCFMQIQSLDLIKEELVYLGRQLIKQIGCILRTVRIADHQVVWVLYELAGDCNVDGCLLLVPSDDPDLHQEASSDDNFGVDACHGNAQSMFDAQCMQDPRDTSCSSF